MNIKWLFKYFYWILILILLIPNELCAGNKLILVLDWFPNPDHAPIYVAIQQGLFKKYGLDLNVITPADPSDAPKWVAIGRGDIALDYQPQTLLQEERGLPIRQIGTLIGQPLNALVVLSESRIKQIAELKGRKIAYSAPEVDLLILQKMLQSAGLKLQDVEPINVHYDLTQALLTKKVSAAIGMMRNVELTQLALLGHSGLAFYPEDYGVPQYSELVFIANINEKHPERFKAFFLALNEARDYLLAHPKESWQVFSKQHPELNNTLNKTVWFQTLPKFAKDFSVIDKQQCTALMRFLTELIKTK